MLSLDRAIWPESERRDLAITWVVVETYTDNSVSSKKGVARPSYDRMMADYRAGRFDAIVCWDLDRLTRVRVSWRT